MVAATPTNPAEQDGTVLAISRGSYFSYTTDVPQDSLFMQLQRQARRAGWTPADIDWSEPFKPDYVAPLRTEVPRLARFHPGNSWTVEQFQEYEIAIMRYVLSQVIYGEQLGLLTGLAIAESAPEWDVRMFAVAQASDEATHVDAFTSYAKRLGDVYPIHPGMRDMISTVCSSKEWDKLALIANIIVEAMGLGSFGYLKRTNTDPVFKHMIKNIISDEARHVAFGVSALKSTLEGLSSAELQERCELLVWCIETMNDRLLALDVAREYGIDEVKFSKAVRMSPMLRSYEITYYSHVGPICSRLGLLDVNDGWLRKRLTQMGVLDTPDWALADATQDAGWTDTETADSYEKF